MRDPVAPNAHLEESANSTRRLRCAFTFTVKFASKLYPRRFEISIFIDITITLVQRISEIKHISDLHIYNEKKTTGYLENDGNIDIIENRIHW